MNNTTSICSIVILLSVNSVASAQYQLPMAPPAEADYQTYPESSPAYQRPLQLPAPQSQPQYRLPPPVDPQQTQARDYRHPYSSSDQSAGQYGSGYQQPHESLSPMQFEQAYGMMPQYTRKPMLWDRRKTSKANLFYDTQARAVGDLITVLVSENTDVDNKEQRALDKGTASSGLFNLTTSAAGDFGVAAGTMQADGKSTSNRSFDGSSEFSSARQFNDRITVTVVHVFPNGNMLVQGKRNVSIAGDKRVLAVSGIVRPFDVRADNSVESRLIASFEVEYEGDGVEQQFTKQGWLGRAVNKVWPY